MKRVKNWSLIAILAMIFLGFSCSDDHEPTLANVLVQVEYPEGFTAQEGVTVKARGAAGIEFEMKTDNTGLVKFKLPIGTYDFSSSEVRVVNKKFSALNGLIRRTIDPEWNENDVLKVAMSVSTRSQLIIKEVYMGGCPTNDGEDSYSFDAYISIYNNSSEPVELQNLCFGAMISNSHAMGIMDEIKEGETDPYWFKEDWTPAAIGYFYFPNQTTLDPYKSKTVVVYAAIDHTQQYTNSVDLSASTNYVMYDVDKFNHPHYYKAPSANIPTTQYLKAAKFGMGTAWISTSSCPNLFLFYPEGKSPEDYANDRTDDDHWMGLDAFPRKKVPAAWIVDGLDAFTAGEEADNVKRINPKVDAGSIYFVDSKGYTLYRNVDKELTEAIEGNKEKLVYNYAMGTVGVDSKYGTTDPSGIDAEASIANGAIIIFKDTNNSGNDFHMRKQSSLKK